MRTSGSAVVKEYIEKYIFINLFKTKHHKYDDQPLARFALSIAFNIVHELDYLVLSNNANNFDYIKHCLKEQVSLMHQEMKHHQPWLKRWFGKTTLPPDFGKLVLEAWSHLLQFEEYFQKQNSLRELQRREFYSKNSSRRSRDYYS